MASPSSQGSPDRSGDLMLRFNNSRNALGFVFMLPAAIFLLGFLTYPWGLVCGSASLIRGLAARVIL